MVIKYQVEVVCGKITGSLRRKFVARQGVTTSPIEVYKVVHRLRARRKQHSIEDKITVSLRRKFVARQGVTTNPTEVYKLVHRPRMRRKQRSIAAK